MSYPPPTDPPPPPPTSGPPYQPGPPPWIVSPPTKKSNRTLWIILGVVGGVVVLCCLGGVLFVGGVGKSMSDNREAAAKDVRISDCSADNQFIGPQATVEVKNSGTRRASYSVRVAFESPDGSTQYGTGIAFVNNLEPGQTGTGEAASFKGGRSASVFKCRVTRVTRL